jgi:two-component system, cell cycle sensor histidine kinase and response regulator CckA
VKPEDRNMEMETRAELLERIRELQDRLGEAEDTLRALRSGEVDAIVATGADGDQIYTLKGADKAYRVLVEEMAEGAVTLSREGFILFSNEQFATMLGVPLERVIGSSIFDWIAAADGNAGAAVLKQGLLTAAKGEGTIEGPGGRAVPVYLSLKPLPLEDNECVCLVVTDLTEQRRMEQVAAAANFHRSIMDQAARAIIVTDPGGRIIRANRAAERLAGQPVLSRAFDEVFPITEAGVPRPFPAILPAVQDGKDVAEFEATADLAGGRTVHLALSAAALLGPASELLGCILTMMDISERVRLEQSLRESEARESNRAGELLAMMEAVPAAVFWAHDSACRKMTGSRKMYDLLRLPHGSNVSLTAHDGETPRHYRAVKDGRKLPPEELPMQRAARLGEAVHDNELDLVFDDGSSRTILGGAVPLLDAAGRPRGAVGAFIDITDRKRLADQLREAQKMESIGVLAGGIAHDFNNLLTSIMGNASLVLDNVPAWDRNRENLEALIDGAHRAADLTRQLLAYAGKGRFLITRVNLSELVRQMLNLLRSSVPATTDLVCEFEEGMPAVDADSGQIQQIIMNLVLNASEALAEKPGRVSVSTSYRAIDDSYIRQAQLDIPSGGYVCLEVEDTGGGMDPATCARIFEPFFTTKFQGRGLGLSAVQGIVRSHRGAILVYSNPGSGSKFTVLLPPASAAAAVPRATGVTGSHQDLLGHGTVLVVDDEPGIRRVAKSALERYGYTVVLAENGAEALDIFVRMPEQISLVLLDLTMPGMTGEEAFTRLRAARRDVPILLTSGYNQIEAIRRFAGLDPAGFIGKPYSAPELAEKVRGVLVKYPVSG